VAFHILFDSAVCDCGSNAHLSQWFHYSLIVLTFLIISHLVEYNLYRLTANLIDIRHDDDIYRCTVRVSSNRRRCQRRTCSLSSCHVEDLQEELTP